MLLADFILFSSSLVEYTEFITLNKLRLERGGEHMVVAGYTTMGISRLIKKIYRYMKFHSNFLNTDISFNNPSIIIKFLQDDLKTLSDGSVSQNFDLGSSYFFMLCRNL